MFFPFWTLCVLLSPSPLGRPDTQAKSVYSPSSSQTKSGRLFFLSVFLGEGSVVHRLGIAVYTKDSDCNKEEISLSLQRSFLLLEKSCNLLSMQERYEKQLYLQCQSFIGGRKQICHSKWPVMSHDSSPESSVRRLSVAVSSRRLSNSSTKY